MNSFKINFSRSAMEFSSTVKKRKVTLIVVDIFKLTIKKESIFIVKDASQGKVKNT